MQTVNLYRYVDENSVTISPIQRADTDVPQMLRLIADTGKALTDGKGTVSVIDAYDVSEWSEIDYSEPDYFLLPLSS